MDIAGSAIGEISTAAVFLYSCLFFLPLSHSFSATLETVSVWTVLGAIGLNAILSVIRSVCSVLGVYREYKKEVLRVGRSLSKVRPIESSATSFRRRLILGQ